MSLPEFKSTLHNDFSNKSSGSIPIFKCFKVQVKPYQWKEKTHRWEEHPYQWEEKPYQWEEKPYQWEEKPYLFIPPGTCM